MPLTVTIKAYYPDDPDQVFDAACDTAEMLEAMSDIAVYEGMPDGRITEGETITVDVTFWGWLKNKGHVMHVETLDAPNRLIQSREHGPSIRQWDHTLTVEPAPEGAVWTDHVVVDAGWQTWFMALFCRYVYRHRHKRRGALRIV